MVRDRYHNKVLVASTHNTKVPVITTPASTHNYIIQNRSLVDSRAVTMQLVQDVTKMLMIK